MLLMEPLNKVTIEKRGGETKWMRKKYVRTVVIVELRKAGVRGGVLQ